METALALLKRKKTRYSRHQNNTPVGSVQNSQMVTGIDKDRKAQRPKRCDNINNKDRNISPNVNINENDLNLKSILNYKPYFRSRHENNMDANLPSTKLLVVLYTCKISDTKQLKCHFHG